MSSSRLRPKRWWYIAPAYLTLWTVMFSLWSLFDGQGMMDSFGVDTGGASDFVMLNSSARYLAIAVGMVLGIWVFRTYYSIITVLLIRLTMDVMDLVAGLQTGIIEDATGVIQSLIMFILPNLFAIYSLRKFK